MAFDQCADSCEIHTVAIAGGAPTKLPATSTAEHTTLLGWR